MNPSSNHPPAPPWYRAPLTWGIVLVVLHAVGAVGVAMGHADQLLPFTPLNLLICAAIVMSFTAAWVANSRCHARAAIGGCAGSGSSLLAIIACMERGSVDFVSHVLNFPIVSSTCSCGFCREEDPFCSGVVALP